MNYQMSLEQICCEVKNNGIISEKAQCYIDRLSDLLYNLNYCLGMMILGSIAKGFACHKKVGIDLVLLIDKKQRKDEVINFLKKNNLYFTPFEDIYYLDEYPQISIFISNYDYFLLNLDHILEHGAEEIIVKKWTIGGFISDVIFKDLSQAIIIFDKNNKYVQLKNKLNREFIFNEENMGCFLKEHVYYKIMITRNQLKEKNYILASVGFYELLVDLERLYCYEKKILNPGFKFLINGIENKEFRNKFFLDLIDCDIINTKHMVKILDQVEKMYFGNNTNE